MPARGEFLTIDRRKLQQVAGRGAGTKVVAITTKTAALAATLAPGSMKQAIRPIISGTKNAPFGIVMVDHPAAPYVLNGTKPHVILPRNKKVLRFTVGGNVVYARRVDHPGTKPNNFLMKAMLMAAGKN